jgi:hypothetical protein
MSGEVTVRGALAAAGLPRNDVYVAGVARLMEGSAAPLRRAAAAGGEDRVFAGGARAAARAVCGEDLVFPAAAAGALAAAVKEFARRGCRAPRG